MCRKNFRFRKCDRCVLDEWGQERYLCFISESFAQGFDENMSVRNLSKFCRRHECVVSLLRAELPNQRAAASACFLLQHRSFAHSSRMNHGRFLSIEGVQGPIPKPLSLTEAKKLLDSAAKHVSGGSSQQGVQGKYQILHSHVHALSTLPCCFGTRNRETHRLKAARIDYECIAMT